MRLQGRERGLTLSSAVWIIHQIDRQTDGLTARHRATAKTALTHTVVRYNSPIADKPYDAFLQTAFILLTMVTIKWSWRGLSVKHSSCCISWVDSITLTWSSNLLNETRPLLPCQLNCIVVFQPLMTSQRVNWWYLMLFVFLLTVQCIGVVGEVERFTENGGVSVKYSSLGKTWLINPQLLQKKVNKS